MPQHANCIQNMTMAVVLGIATLAIAAPSQDNFPGLGDPGKATKLVIQANGTNHADAGKSASLVGPDARLQLVVTGEYESGQVRDWSRSADYKATPDGIVSVDESGLIVPTKDGKAIVTVTGPHGLTGKVEVHVAHFDNPPAINFPNQVVPVFTKYGCNGGGCHGKSGGQNNFALSLLGFEPKEDYEYLVTESVGRRVIPTAPDESLLLTKATNDVSHGGGHRIKPDSHDYRVLRRWIMQGMPYGSDEDPVVASISVYPDYRLMPRNADQQLKVVAHYSDGSIEDVTHTANYESNDKDLAEVDEGGKVSTHGRPGTAAIMIRYQAQVAVYRATVPLGMEVKDLPVASNFIDELVFKNLKQLGLPASEVCDDATYIRRVTLDIAGRLPTADESKAFLESSDSDKRAKLVDQLLVGEDYADYFANKWSAVLRNKQSSATAKRGTYAFHAWIKDGIATNRPYNEFVADVIAATGDMRHNPPVAWYREVDQLNEQVEDVAQLFLGVRIQCARCHHHPFEKWSQEDYYGLAAFFSTTKKKNGAVKEEFKVYPAMATAQSVNPKHGRPVKATGLGDGAPMDLQPNDDPRRHLAQWMAQADNPFFAHSLVNRYWKHFFGRGLVDPEDDMRATNPACNPELLQALAKHFITSGFDMRDLIRTITVSKTYQLSSLPNDYNASDKQSFSRFYPRRLPAEVLLDSIDLMLGTRTSFGGLPSDYRAIQLPGHGGAEGSAAYFLNVFGRPAGASACECERSGDASLAQSLHLINSSDIHKKLSQSIAGKLAGDKNTTIEDKVTEIYYRAFSRKPTESELIVASDHVKKFEAGKQVDAYQDILWALINTKEFLFNH